MKKMNKIKPIFGNHQIYQEIVNYPPEGFEYLGVSENTKRGTYYQNKRRNERLGWFLQKIKIPRLIIMKPGNYDIIHSSRGIIPIQLFDKKPWVIDMEHVHSFFGLNPHLIKNRFWKRFIERTLASKNCKAVLCHCEATRQAFFKFLDCEKFKEKIKLLYPVSHLIPLKKERHSKIRILAVISIFYNKSGPQILEAFSRLEQKHKNIELWFRADVPEKFRKRYNSKNIKYMDYLGNIIPRDKLIKEIYSKCDIFLYPTLTDSFGYSLIDAKIAKLPIVATNLFAVPEIVSHKKNGLIADIPGYDLKKEYLQSYSWKKMTGKKEEMFIGEIVKNLEILIKDKKSREEYGENGFNEVKNGKFSIRERNKILKEVYERALIR